MLRQLLKHHQPYYDHNFNRTEAAYLTHEIYEKYKKYLVGRDWYD
jgi:hypothetical protein